MPNPAQRYPYVIPYYTSHTHATIQIHTYPTLKIFPSCLPKVEGLGLNFPPRISLHFFSSYLPVTPVHSCVPVLRSSCVGTFPQQFSLSLSVTQFCSYYLHISTCSHKLVLTIWSFELLWWNWQSGAFCPVFALVSCDLPQPNPKVSWLTHSWLWTKVLCRANKFCVATW